MKAMPNLQSRFRDLSIKRKVMLVTITASLVALFAVAGGLYAFQLRNFRHTFRRELQTLAQVMADNCATALAFDDAKTATDVMAPLHVKPEIENAAVLGKDGKVFAAFGGNDECPQPQPGDPAGIVDRGASWMVVQPIVLDGERIGTFFMDVDYARPRGELQGLYLGVTAAVLGGSLVLVILLTLRLQDFILRPIRLLAGASEAVASRHDYSVRVPEVSRDELGQLSSAFNQMLARVQEQDKALRFAEVKFRSIIEQLPAITYVAELGLLAKWSFVSPQISSLLGYTVEEWLTQGSLWLEAIHPDDRVIAERAEAEAYESGIFLAEYRMFTRSGELRWFRDQAILADTAEGDKQALYGVLMDISEVKAAAAHLADLNRQLVETSRHAGMAEVATGVLHNVGNVLNSVNISAGILVDRLRGSKVPQIAKAAALLTGQNGNLAHFLTEDPQGQKLPGYLAKLGEHLIAENALLLGEADQLGHHIEHIKEVVAMQQSYAKVSGVFENLPLDLLVEDAIAMNYGAFERHGVSVERRFSPAPPARVDRHKVLQILINLIRNAKYALDEVEGPNKTITISIEPAGEHVHIRVADNGIGIPPENLDRIFAHGFTTRKEGHGFGLHSGANAAREIGGTLTVQSDGLGHGATFTLELPAAAQPDPA